jgi:hypothetical protein
MPSAPDADYAFFNPLFTKKKLEEKFMDLQGKSQGFISYKGFRAFTKGTKSTPKSVLHWCSPPQGIYTLPFAPSMCPCPLSLFVPPHHFPPPSTAASSIGSMAHWHHFHGWICANANEREPMGMG